MPPIPYPQVPATMNKAVFNPVMYRPLFECLELVTCRTFETPAAGTIPLFLLDPEYVRGDLRRAAPRTHARRGRPHEKILDVLAGPSTMPKSCARSGRISAGGTPPRRACSD